jgi:hypothetical protein
VAKLECSPGRSFPEVFRTEAEREAFYRLVRNKRVTLDNVLAPHVDATVARCAEHPVVLAVHDTTEFRFGGQVEREGLGRLGQSGHGFFGHFTLAVAPGAHADPLGMLRVQPWSRTEPSTKSLLKQKKVTYKQSHEMRKEQVRWAAGAAETEVVVGDATQLIHVMDSEADNYSLMSHFSESDERFVIRLYHERMLDPAESDVRLLSESIATAPTVAIRTVELSRRGRPPGGKRKRQAARDVREATLVFSAKKLVLSRPKSAKRSLPSKVVINVVHVQERDAPEGVEPVEWKLATTEPVDTAEQVLAVVDHYRARWIIEEYFKALKTGCAFEKRQLESADTLYTALAIFVPIAWGLLRLRTISRVEPDASAESVMSGPELKVLRALGAGSLPAKPSVREALLAVAKLGGHIRQNGDPGWQVLGRGYVQLRTMVEGFELALQGE